MSISVPPERGSGPASSIAELLARLAVAFGRRRAYPESHPSVRAAETQAFETLAAVVAERTRLSLSVGHGELLVDNAPAPAAGNVPGDLAERLRQRGVASITFDNTVTVDTLSKAISWLAIEPSTDGDANTANRYVPELRGVVIRRIEYGRLALGDEHSAEQTSSAAIWRALAAVIDEDDEDDEGSLSVRRGGATRTSGADDARPDATSEEQDANAADDFADADPVAMAGAIERRMTRDGYARRVAFVLLRVADQVSQAPAAQRAELGERLRAVLSRLQSSSVGTIIRSVGVGADQRRFMSNVIDALPVGAVIEWLESAAQATDQSVSHQLLRLLAKLSTRAQESNASTGAEQSLREAARELVHGWTLDDPNTTSHGSLLDAIGRVEPVRASRASFEPDPARLVQISLEADAFGEDAAFAAQSLIASGHVAQLLGWAAEAPGRAAAESLRAHVRSPAAIRAILLHEPLDHAEARALLASLDATASGALLDVLRDAENRATRRLVYDRLREYGWSLAPQLIQRLDGAPWYFIRNLLALLRDTSAGQSGAQDVAGASLFRFLGHQQEQVRAEALHLLANDPATRDRALRQALEDRSDRVVQMAVEMLGADERSAPRHPVSPSLAQQIVQFVSSKAYDDELLARAVRALADAPTSALVRDALMTFASRRSLLLRRLVLSDARPVVVAAIEVLAERYGQDAKAAPLVASAAAHSDTRLRTAVTRAAQRATQRGRAA